MINLISLIQNPLTSLPQEYHSLEVWKRKWKSLTFCSQQYIRTNKGVSVFCKLLRKVLALASPKNLVKIQKKYIFSQIRWKLFALCLLSTFLTFLLSVEHYGCSWKQIIDDPKHIPVYKAWFPFCHHAGCEALNKDDISIIVLEASQNSGLGSFIMKYVTCSAAKTKPAFIFFFTTL